MKVAKAIEFAVEHPDLIAFAQQRNIKIDRCWSVNASIGKRENNSVFVRVVLNLGLANNAHDDLVIIVEDLRRGNFLISYIDYYRP